MPTSYDILTPFAPFVTMVICSLICLCTLVAYLTNSVDPAPLGLWFIVYASMAKAGKHLKKCSRCNKQTTFSGQKIWGLVAQSIARLIADQGFVSSVLARSHTFVEVNDRNIS